MLAFSVLGILAFISSQPFLLMIWVGRIWLVAGRGELDEDPIAYAISDRFSWKLMVPLVAAFVLATVAWP